jgi:hypothetical protein
MLIQTEVAFHKAQELKEIDWREPETFTFTDYLADFRADFHDIRGNAAYAECLGSGTYVPSEKLAKELLASGSAGVVYPSVRNPGGTCIVCFRPALVTNVRKDRTITISFTECNADPTFS